ncbi:FAD-dependent oxidoreductase [Variovorax sp. PBL-E5]|uniref:FAD-dependent oxidoreductase n=1 Tax=Variovorax sp. PBL-E5 TaxID=434014 RepID=UPI0013A593C6|nr:FAD-dependent monooxygenase [Variovorax sp. PBL-E5]
MQQPPTTLNIGIAGAGPAGLATAIALSRLGHRIEVFEKHPTLEPLGAGLLIQPQGLHALDALGVRRAFDHVSVPIERLLGASHRGWRVVDSTTRTRRRVPSAGLRWPRFSTAKRWRPGCAFLSDARSNR